MTLFFRSGLAKRVLDAIDVCFGRLPGRLSYVTVTAGVIFAAWQTLRADDELWVADDPLRAPEA